MTASPWVAPSTTRLGRMLGRSEARLFLTSATLLFVELVLIRWIPANVTYIGFFTNFTLMASFLGIGLGILAGRRWPKVGLAPFAILLVSIVALVVNAQLNIQLASPSELVFGVGVSQGANVNFLVLPLMFVLVTLAMAMLALPLGGCFGAWLPCGRTRSMSGDRWPASPSSAACRQRQQTRSCGSE